MRNWSLKACLAYSSASRGFFSSSRMPARSDLDAGVSGSFASRTRTCVFKVLSNEFLSLAMVEYACQVVLRQPSVGMLVPEKTQADDQNFPQECFPVGIAILRDSTLASPSWALVVYGWSGPTARNAIASAFRYKSSASPRRRWSNLMVFASVVIAFAYPDA